MTKLDTRQSRQRRRLRIRARVSGTAGRPRLSVFRSLNNIYAQLIDDVSGRTLLAASTLSEAARGTGKDGAKRGAASLVGSLLGKQALEKGITEVVFDRGGFRYHGRVKALAEAARQAGLKF
ncbi:MAG: 50S ribosomal protein L18 [Chloroflexi bacterium]|nr:50S ribosomal protein L18 [Chloroflexota bacterium]